MWATPDTVLKAMSGGVQDRRTMQNLALSPPNKWHFWTISSFGLSLKPLKFYFEEVQFKMPIVLPIGSVRYTDGLMQARALGCCILEL